MSLICLSALHTASSLSLSQWESAGLMLASCSMSHFSLQNNTEVRFVSSQGFTEIQPSGFNRIQLQQTNTLPHKTQMIFSVWSLNSQVLHLTLEWTRICSEGCCLEGSLWETTTHIIFRKSAMCFRMKGDWRLSWQLLSDGRVYIYVYTYIYIFIYIYIYICIYITLLSQSLILNQIVERSEQWLCMQFQAKKSRSDSLAGPRCCNTVCQATTTTLGY